MSDTVKTAPVDYVYDHPDGARRPTEDDVDPSLVDYSPAPLPGMPYAAQLNQWARCVSGLARVSPVAVFVIDFATGAPHVDRLSVCSEVVVVGDLTVTDNGAGDTTVTWAAGTFPTSAADPDATVCTDGSWLQPTVVAVANGFRVKTRNSAGTLTDVRVKVNLY